VKLPFCYLQRFGIVQKRSFSAALTCAADIAIALGANAHITNDGLTAITDVDVLDADVLVSALSEPPKHLNLVRKSSQQPSGCRPERRDPPLRYEGASDHSSNQATLARVGMRG
ncbi:MAG TPA: hypothetical protein VKE98_06770, partial [Gemmataceae bacterium]|nr:hypothetical protein [Gemmataceae bacterium]